MVGLLTLLVLGVVLIGVSVITLTGRRTVGPDQFATARRRHAILTFVPGAKWLTVTGNASGWLARTFSEGRHFWLWRFVYEFEYHDVSRVINSDMDIALVIALEGEALPEGQQFGRMVDCDRFADGEAFLRLHGQKGRQLQILTEGTHRINPHLFEVIGSRNAGGGNLRSGNLRRVVVEPGKVGLVTTYAGRPAPSGALATSTDPALHDSFQQPARFIENGGCSGLQLEVLSPSTYTLNPWFASVEQVDMVRIPSDAVGVVLSSFGRSENGADSVSAASPSADDLVNVGERGVWRDPLLTGQHALNTRLREVVLVPTHSITIDWSNRVRPETNYDANLRAIDARSSDAHRVRVEVTQKFIIDRRAAPALISKIGSPGNLEAETLADGQVKYPSIRGLITRVLRPTIENHFLQAAQEYTALEFPRRRAHIESEANAFICSSLSKIGVRAEGTYIIDIDLPDALERIQQEEARDQLDISRHATRLERERGDAEIALVRAHGHLAEVRALLEIERQDIAARYPTFEAYMKHQEIDAATRIQLPQFYVAGGGGLSDPMASIAAGTVGLQQIFDFFRKKASAEPDNTRLVMTRDAIEEALASERKLPLRRVEGILGSLEEFGFRPADDER